MSYCQKCGKKHCKRHTAILVVSETGKSIASRGSKKNIEYASSSSDASSSSTSETESGSYETSSSSSEASSFEEKKKYQSKSLGNKKPQESSIQTILSKPITPIKLQTVVYSINRDFTPQDFYSSKTNKLKNHGKMVFTVGKGLIREEASRGKDFENLRSDQKGGNHDLVKRMKQIVISTYPETLRFEFPTVPLQGDQYCRGKNYISKDIPAGTFNKNNTRFEIELFDKDITESIREYANTYRGYNPDNINENVFRTKHHMIVPLKNPIMLIHNTKYESEAITSPNVEHLKETDSCMIDLNRGEECLKLAHEMLTKKIPYGNINDKFKVIVSTPMPTNRNEKDWKGLADIPHLMACNSSYTGLKTHPNSGLDFQTHFSQHPFLFKTWFEIEYTRLDGKSL
jgi:hypothetical protein